MGPTATNRVPKPPGSTMRSRAWVRRRFLNLSGSAALGACVGAPTPVEPPPEEGGRGDTRNTPTSPGLEVFLCGDVMTGRGIDQVLPHPSRPRIYESYVTSARGYVELAERRNGPIPRPVDFGYVWGDARAELEARAPDVRVINLETSVTTSDDAWPKGINYRMHPRNVPCLEAAAIDCCVLANNHVMDWGVAGLLETLETLQGAGLSTTGAGRDRAEADRPAVHEVTGKGRVLVFGLGSPTSGIPHQWAATPTRPGVSLVTDLSPDRADRVATRIRRWKQSGDVVVVSIHWGGNWGYSVPERHREFAHRLVDAGAADVVHGHSSHHPRPVEVHDGRLILYGCGDFLNDYEGISGREEFRSELVLGYFLELDPTGRLRRLEMTPFRTRGFRLERVKRGDAEWMRSTLDRESRRLGTRVELTSEGALRAGT